MDSYKFIYRFAVNLLMLEDFSILNPTAQAEQISRFISKTCNGFVELDYNDICSAVTDAVNQNEWDSHIDPEQTAQPVPPVFTLNELAVETTDPNELLQF